jgi:hypothetical protein
MQEPDGSCEHDYAQNVDPAENFAGEWNRGERIEQQSQARKSDGPQVPAGSHSLQRNHSGGTAHRKLQHDCIPAFGCPEEHGPNEQYQGNPFHDYCKHNNLNSPVLTSPKPNLNSAGVG